jgi:hypothetical protein
MRRLKTCDVCQKSYIPRDFENHPFRADPKRMKKCHFCWGKVIKDGQIIYIIEPTGSSDDIEKRIAECEAALKSLLDGCDDEYQ